MTKTDADRITDLETQFAELKQQLADHQDDSTDRIAALEEQTADHKTQLAGLKPS
jgi:hypothetical protein